MKKICTKCKIEKDICEFYFRKKRNVYESQCKKCCRNKQKKYTEKNYEQVMNKNKEWQKNNPDSVRKAKRKWKRNNPEYIKKENRSRAGKIKVWRNKNREKLNNKLTKRRQQDINFKITCYLRSRISTAVKNDIKAGSAVKDLGCSLNYLKKHLEDKFYNNPITGEEMTFKNYGKWHIDHIIPLSFFDLSNIEQFLKACHYTNLQPLWAKDNLSKSNKLGWERNNGD